MITEQGKATLQALDGIENDIKNYFGSNLLAILQIGSSLYSENPNDIDILFITENPITIKDYINFRLSEKSFDLKNLDQNSELLSCDWKISSGGIQIEFLYNSWENLKGQLEQSHPFAIGAINDSRVLFSRLDFDELRRKFKPNQKTIEMHLQLISDLFIRLLKERNVESFDYLLQRLLSNLPWMLRTLAFKKEGEWIIRKNDVEYWASKNITNPEIIETIFEIRRNKTFSSTKKIFLWWYKELTGKEFESPALCNK